MKRYLKALIGKFVYFLLKTFNVSYHLDRINKDNHITYCKRSTVHGSNVVFNADCKIWNLQGNPQLIEIGDNTIVDGELQVFAYGGKLKIGKNCYVGRDTKVWSADSVEIGDDVLISHNVNIIDTNSHEVDSVERSERHKDHLTNGVWKTKGSVQTAPIIIKDKAWISFNVSILKGVVIGEGAIVAAGALVIKDVEPYTMVAGVPAKFVKKTT